MSAQEAFALMMRGQVAPALRELGLKGSGQAFSIRSEQHWALIGFQKSTASNAAGLKFTINLQVVPRDSWAKAAEEQPWLGAKPSPNVIGSVPGGWWQRIGGLLSTADDHWWRIEPDRPTQTVGEEVIA